MQQSLTPERVAIIPRNREHQIAESLGTDWFDGHPFKTAWFNAMSITFPLGEKFFIDSVRYYAERIEDPKLREEIRGFIGQEGFHRREHDRYNRALCRLRGYDLDYLEGRLETKIAFHALFDRYERIEFAGSEPFEPLATPMFYGPARLPLRFHRS